MGRAKSNPFETAQKKHDALVAAQPVGRTALMNSLKNLDQAGSVLVKDHDIGIVPFAFKMFKTLGAVASLEVKPPLTDDHKTFIADKISTYEMIIEGNQPGSAEPPTQPTDTEQIDTAKRKS